MRRSIFIVMATAALVGCGTDQLIQPGKDSANIVVDDAQTARAKAALPNMVMVRVPVDASGNLLSDQAETRTVKSGKSDFASDNLAVQAFDQAQTIQVAGDSLDQDTSTNSWHWGASYPTYQYRGYGSRRYNYKRTPWYPGKVVGRGLWWGRNPYVRYSGRPYYYNYHRSYSHGRYRYYTYCW